MKRTVYIPVEIECNDESPITESEALQIVSSMAEDCRNGFFSSDKMWDRASEVLGEYGMIDFGYTIKNPVGDIKLKD